MTALCLAALIFAAPAKDVALGDSFTAGTGATPAQSFPAVLAAHWGVSLENLGVNGFTTDDLIAIELPRIAAVHPTFVTLAIGANDIVRGHSPGGYRRNLKTIFAALTKEGLRGKKLVVLPQPDWSQSPAAEGFGSQTAIAQEIGTFNDVLREETELAGGFYLDLFPTMQREAGARQIADDGLHPSAVAYAEWAKLIADVVPRP